MVLCFNSQKKLLYESAITGNTGSAKGILG